MKYILLKSEVDFEAIAQKVRIALNINGKNKSPHCIDQERDGLHRGGGQYFLFEVIGVEIYLIKNRGEVLLEGYEEHAYYIYMTLQLEFDSNEFVDSLTDYISLTLKENNFEVLVIEE